MTIIYGESFVSTGVGVSIPLPSDADFFKIENITQLNLAPNPGVVVGGRWYGSKFLTGASAANDGIRVKKSNSSNVINEDLFSTATASDGFTYHRTNPVIESQAANAITAITNASPAVVSQTNTYSENDILMLYGTTGMLQVAGMPFQISTVSGSTYTLTGLQASGFGAAGTAGFTRRVSKFAAMEPQYLFITEITQATQAVVRTSIDPTSHYVVGMKIYFNVPQSFGMTEINGLTGTVLAINATNYTMTVNIDSSAFTAFAFPASTAVPTTALFATLAPAGSSTQYNPVSLVQTGWDFNIQPFRSGQFVPFMFLAGGAQSPAGASADVINWTAIKYTN